MNVAPQRVPVAVVRRLDSGAAEGPVLVQHVEVARVLDAVVVPRQIDGVGRRLTALQLENDHLRAELEQRRSA